MARPGLSLVVTGGCMVAGGGLLLYFSSIANEATSGEFGISGVGLIVGGLVAICYGVVHFGKHLAQGVRNPEERDAISRAVLVHNSLCYVAGGRKRLTDATVAKVHGALQQLGLPVSEATVRQQLQGSPYESEALRLDVNDRKYLFSMQERHELLRIAAWVGADGERLSAAAVSRLIELGSYLDLTKDEVTAICGLLLDEAPEPEPEPEPTPAVPAELPFPHGAWLSRLYASGLPGLGPGSAAWHSRSRPGQLLAICGPILALVGILALLEEDSGRFVQVGGAVMILFGLGAGVFGIAEWVGHKRASPAQAAERNKRGACSVLVTAMAYVGQADAGSQDGRIAAFTEVLKEITGSAKPMEDADKAFAYFGKGDALQGESFRSGVPGLSAEQRDLCIASARRVASAEGPITRASEERLAKLAMALKMPEQKVPTVPAV